MRKAIISFVMPVCPSVRPHGTTLPPLGGFSRKLIFKYFFWKSLKKIQVQLKLEKNDSTLHWDVCIFFIVCRSFLVRMRSVSDQSCRENQTHIWHSITFFFEKCAVWDNVQKFCRAGLATNDNLAHAHFILDTKVYKHTLRICNTYCFSIATIFARTRLSVSLYVFWLSCIMLAPRTFELYDELLVSRYRKLRVMCRR
jgi:hypothetical protein